MPRYQITDEETGAIYTLTFDHEPTEVELQEAAEAALSGGGGEGPGFLRKWALEKPAAIAGGAVAGATRFGSWAYGAAAAVERMAAGVDRWMGKDEWAERKLRNAEELDAIAAIGGVQAGEYSREVSELWPHAKIPKMIGETAGILAPSLIAAPVAGPGAFGIPGLGLGAGGGFGAPAGAAGAQSAAGYLHEARAEHMAEYRGKYPNMSDEDLQLMAIGRAAPWAALSGAKTAALTGIGGWAGGRFLGTLGPEAAGVGGRLGGRGAAAAGKQIGGAALLEGAEEGIDEAVQAAIDKWTIQEEMTGSDAVDRVVAAVGMGALFGGAIETAARSEQVEAADIEAERVKQAEEAEAAMWQEMAEPMLRRSAERAVLRRHNAQIQLQAAGVPVEGESVLEQQLRGKVLGEEIDPFALELKDILARPVPPPVDPAVQPPVAPAPRGERRALERGAETKLPRAGEDLLEGILRGDIPPAETPPAFRETVEVEEPRVPYPEKPLKPVPLKTVDEMLDVKYPTKPRRAPSKEMEAGILKGQAVAPDIAGPRVGVTHQGAITPPVPPDVESGLEFLRGPEKPLTKRERELLETRTTGELIGTKDVQERKKLAKRVADNLRSIRKKRRGKVYASVLGGIDQIAITAGLEAGIAVAEATGNATEAVNAAVKAVLNADPKAADVGIQDLRDYYVEQLAAKADPVAWRDEIMLTQAAGVLDPTFKLTHKDFEKYSDTWGTYRKVDQIIDATGRVEEEGAWNTTTAHAAVEYNAWVRLLEEAKHDPHFMANFGTDKGKLTETQKDDLRRRISEWYVNDEISKLREIARVAHEGDPSASDWTYEKELIHPGKDIEDYRHAFGTDEDYETAVEEVSEEYWAESGGLLDADDDLYALHPLRGASVDIGGEAARNWSDNPMFTHMTAYGNLDSIAKNGLLPRPQQEWVFARNAKTGDLSRIPVGVRESELFFVTPVSFKLYWEGVGVDEAGNLMSDEGSVNEEQKSIINITQGLPYGKGKKVVLGWNRDAMRSFGGVNASVEDPLMSGQNEAWIKDAGSVSLELGSPSRQLVQDARQSTISSNPVNIKPEDLFVWNGKDWVPLAEHQKRVKRNRTLNALRKIKYKLSDFRKKVNRAGLFTRIDLGTLNIPLVAAEGAVTLAVKSLEAGYSVADALEKAYYYVSKPDLNKKDFDSYMLGRLQVAINEASKGNTLEDAVKVSEEPLEGKTYEELATDEARTELKKDAGIAPTPPKIEDFDLWYNKLTRFYNGQSDVIAVDAAFQGLGQQVVAHTSQADAYSGKLTAMLLDQDVSYVDASTFSQRWFGVVSPEQKKAKEEFEDYQRRTYEGEKVDASKYSELGQALIKGWGNVSIETGRIMTEGKLEVKLPSGKTRRGDYSLGGKYWIRKYNDEVNRILEPLHKGAPMTDGVRMVGNILKKHGQIENVTVDEVVDWKNRHLTPEIIKAEDPTGEAFNGYARQNAFFANAEKARLAEKPPAELMTFKFEDAMRYVNDWSERMAQIDAYGQKLRDGDDLFEKVLRTISDPRLGSENKYTRAADYVRNLRKSAYGLMDKDLGGLAKSSYLLNKSATLIMLTGGMNAMRNMTGVGPTTFVFGTGNSLKAFMEMRNYAAAAKQARAWGVLRADIDLLLSGNDVTMEGAGYLDKASRLEDIGVRYALKTTGFTHAENFVRTHAAFTASAFVSEGVGAVKNQDNPALAEEFKDMAERLGVDPKRLVAEDNPTGKATSDFIRRAVKEVQGGYRFDQLPAFMANPMGKFMWKFGSYGMQVTRAQVRNVWKPIAKRPLNRRSYLPLLRMLATAVGSGELLYALRDLLFGKDRPDATLHEIINGDSKVSKLFNRLINDVTYAGTLGLVGDMAGLVKNISAKQRVRNPLDPAGLSIITNTLWAIHDMWSARGWDTDVAMRWLNDMFAFWRYGEPAVEMGAGALGVEWDRAERHKAENNRNFLRNASRRFQEAVGDDVKNMVSPPRFAPSPYSRYYKRVKDYLMIGDVPAARKAALDFAAEIDPEDRDRSWVRLSQSIMRSQPMKIGDSTSKEIQQDFISWARRNLSDGDVARIMDVQKTYMGAARNAGLIGDAPKSISRPMKALMNLKEPKGRKRKRSKPSGSPADYLKEQQKRMKEAVGY